MSRRAFATAVILMVAGLIVAAVRAQDAAPRQAASITDSSDAGASLNGSHERSVLSATPRQRGAVGTGLAEGGSAGTLVDRLQRIRRSVSQQYDPSEPSRSASRALIDGPVSLDPAQAIESSSGLKVITDSKETGPVGAAATPFISQDTVDRNLGQIDSARRSPTVTPSAAESSPRLTAAAPRGGALLDSAGPALQVSTIGPPAITIGRATEFTITLGNRSAVTAAEVFVRVALPGWVDLESADPTVGSTQIREQEAGGQQLIWNATQVAGGAQERLSLKLTPRESRPFDLTVDWTLRPTSSHARIDVQEPQLEISLLGPQDILYGESAVYALQLKNPGSGDADDVTVDFAYGGQRLPAKRIGKLAAGETTEIKVELTAREAGLLRVAAVATAEGDLRAEVAEDVRVRRARLQVEVTGSPMKFAGSVASYQIRLRNAGDAPATDIATSILLPAGTEYVGGEMSVTNSGGLVKRLDELAAGGERTFQVQCKLTAPGENRIEARAQASGELAASGFCVTSVKALADLKLAVNDPSGPTPVSSDAIYEVNIVNRGTTAASQVSVVVQFSEGIEPVEAGGHAADLVPGQVLFQPIPRIEVGEKITLKIKARADREGNHRFRAEVRCTKPETVLVAEESTYFFGEPATTARSASGGVRRQ